MKSRKGFMTNLEQLEALVERLIEGLSDSELSHFSTAFHWNLMNRDDYERETENTREQRNKNLAEWREIKEGLNFNE